MSPKGRGMSPEDRRAFAAGFGVHLPAPKPWPTAHNVPHSGETIRLGRSPCRKPTADDVAKEFLAWASQQEQFSGNWLLSLDIQYVFLRPFCEALGWPMVPYRKVASALCRLTERRQREERNEGKRVSWVEYFVP